MMNRRDALKGIVTTATAAAVPLAAVAAQPPRAPNPYGWPDRVKAGDAKARNMRPYLDGKRVYGGVDACESEGWIRVIRRDPDNHEPNGTAHYPRTYDLLRGNVEFRTVRDDGSWPDQG